MTRHARLLMTVAVLLLAAAAGFRVASALAPERLHQAVEGWLERATDAEAEIASLRLVMGFPIRLEGTGLRLYDGALTVESARAQSRPVRVVDLAAGSAPDELAAWVRETGARVLNVAGPRESESPGIARAAGELLSELFARL